MSNEARNFFDRDAWIWEAVVHEALSHPNSFFVIHYEELKYPGVSRHVLGSVGANGDTVEHAVDVSSATILPIRDLCDHFRSRKRKILSFSFDRGEFENYLVKAVDFFVNALTEEAELIFSALTMQREAGRPLNLESNIVHWLKHEDELDLVDTFFELGGERLYGKFVLSRLARYCMFLEQISQELKGCLHPISNGLVVTVRGQDHKRTESLLLESALISVILIRYKRVCKKMREQKMWAAAYKMLAGTTPDLCTGEFGSVSYKQPSLPWPVLETQ